MASSNFNTDSDFNFNANLDATAETDARLLWLSPTDNVCAAAGHLPCGEKMLCQGTMIQVEEIPMGHKLAACAIATGEKIIKCGVPIGSATCDITPGQYVHTHNLKSDYLPTFTLESGQEFIKS